MTLLLLLIIGLQNLLSARISDMNNEINLQQEESIVKKKLCGHSNRSRSTSSIGCKSTEPSSESPDMRRFIVALYGVKSVHADVVSPTPRTAHPVTLCVVDSGIFQDHNAFPAEFISGDDSVRAGQWDADVNWHGTHVAVAT